jgi:hypothetical protein
MPARKDFVYLEFIKYFQSIAKKADADAHQMNSAHRLTGMKSVPAYGATGDMEKIE